MTAFSAPFYVRRYTCACALVGRNAVMLSLSLCEHVSGMLSCAVIAVTEEGQR